MKKLNNKILITCLVIITTYSVSYFIENKEFSVNNEAMLYNPLFNKLPNSYVRLLNEKSIDSVVNLKKKKIYTDLKFNSYLIKNTMYQELILIKKVNDVELLKPNNIRFNIYPKSIRDGESKYFTLESEGIIYRYKKQNYQVVRQVLPNIEFIKILTYTRFWQSLINNINSDLYVHNGVQNKDKRNHDFDDSAYEFLFKLELEKKEIPYLQSNNKFLEKGKVIDTKQFIKYLKETNLQLINISNENVFWENTTKVKEFGNIDFLNFNEERFKLIMKPYFEGSISFSDVFDTKKIASYYSLLNLYTNKSEESLYLRFNEESQLFEPFYLYKKLGLLNMYVKNIEIHDIEFSKLYAKNLKAIYNSENTKNLISENKDVIKERLVYEHQYFPKEIFDENIFYHNKLIIKKALNPSNGAKIFLDYYDTNKVDFLVDNWTIFPIEIKELSYQGKKHIINPREESVVIPFGEMSKVTFDLPRSYNNLFVHKKKKNTGFIFEKDIFKLRVGYQIAGTDNLVYSNIIPYKNLDSISNENDLFRKTINLNSFPFIDVDEINNLITFNTKDVILDKPFVIPSNYTVIATEGQRIDIIKGGKIISKSPIKFIGTSNNHIKVYSSDGYGQGICVLGAKKQSELSYVDFSDLSNPSHGFWEVTGAITFYESPIIFDNILIENNTCEDAINVIRTDFKMANTTFRNTQSDAFDGDFITGEMTNCFFQNLGNDAVDVSGSNIRLFNVEISKAGDKGVSAGENSVITAEKINIYDCEIAIAGKDLSKVFVSNSTISNSKLGFTAFQKKPEFGPSNIVATKMTLKNINTTYLIEKSRL